jgi:hypothetical protein
MGPCLARGEGGGHTYLPALSPSVSQANAASINHQRIFIWHSQTLESPAHVQSWRQHTRSGRDLAGETGTATRADRVAIATTQGQHTLQHDISTMHNYGTGYAAVLAAILRPSQSCDQYSMRWVVPGNCGIEDVATLLLIY